ncbi:ABC transporter ATP-binding protein [Marinilactibacillus sp. Marseille-P9653]|uniref:iron ABC transporter ATP-binding protein n=1 Tax=Marinilactibacillus sp. Marseille-P9653 TaxID=2866583 RepID=UPI001CE4A388|nr:ATP-binding cassette domain-containing protein [Marinilactibacillus sp. Marseille-P9653]
MIDLNQVSKIYKEKIIVDSVTIPIEKGKLTACIGPNGAGKTTLLEMVSRLIPKDTGEIYIDGAEIKSWKSGELAKKLSVLKQSNKLSMRLTIKELVSFGRFPYTKGRLNDHCHELIEQSLNQVGLLDIADQYIDTLSGGQLQRAMIAMVLAQDTDYILLDEPLNNLDMKYSVQLMDIIRKFVDEFGKTVITVIHDINFAAAYADNVIAMKEGKVFAAGPVKQIITPKNIKNIFDIDVEVIDRKGKKFVMYY